MTKPDEIEAAERRGFVRALERAAEVCGGRAWKEVQPAAANALFAAAAHIRALIPPADAPAAECTSQGHWCVDLSCPNHGAAPAAETGKCMQCGGALDRCGHGRSKAAETGKGRGAEALLREAEDGLADALEAEMKYRRQRDDQTANFHSGRGCVYRWLVPMLRKLAARAAPPKDPPAP